MTYSCHLLLATVSRQTSITTTQLTFTHQKTKTQVPKDHQTMHSPTQSTNQKQTLNLNNTNKVC